MITPPLLRIAYLPFYVDYYEGICANFPQEKAEIVKACAQKLEEEGSLIWDGELLCDAEAANAAGLQLAGENVDCVVVFTSIAVFGAIPWAALQHLNVPILIWNAQQIQTVGESYSMVDIVRHTGQIGSQALANTLVREGRWFRVLAGYEKSERTREEMRRFFNVIRTVASLKKARLLAIGEVFPAMTDILIDENTLQKIIGASVIHISGDELTCRYQATEQTELKHASITELSSDEASRSARLSATVNALVEEHHAHGGSLNCHGGVCLKNSAIGITACYSLGVQNALGRPFTCTGDIPTALAMLMLKNLTGISMYTEVQVMDEMRNAVVIANSGEGEDGIRRKNCDSVVSGNTNFVGLHGRGASFVYPLEPGPATLISLTPTPRGVKPFRLIVAEGEILQETLPDSGALAGFFRFKNAELHAGYTAWLEAGAVHHAATTLGHWTSELKAVAALLDIEFVGI
ncbi:MAG: hypothetical protein ABI443_08105 [Chthoniobacterales bacterium]